MKTIEIVVVRRKEHHDRPSLYFLLIDGDLDSPNFRFSEIDRDWDRNRTTQNISHGNGYETRIGEGNGNAND